MLWHASGVWWIGPSASLGKQSGFSCFKRYKLAGYYLQLRLRLRVIHNQQGVACVYTVAVLHEYVIDDASFEMLHDLLISSYADGAGGVRCST